VEECGDVSHNTTDHEPTTTAAATSAALDDTHQQASNIELEARRLQHIYTTYYHLSLPPENDVLPCCTGYHGYYTRPQQTRHPRPRGTWTTETRLYNTCEGYNQQTRRLL
jgi:hypothetical protein